MTKELFFLADAMQPLHDAAAELRRAGYLVRNQPHDLNPILQALAEIHKRSLAESTDKYMHISREPVIQSVPFLYVLPGQASFGAPAANDAAAVIVGVGEPIEFSVGRHLALSAFNLVVVPHPPLGGRGARRDTTRSVSFPISAAPASVSASCSAVSGRSVLVSVAMGSVRWRLSARFSNSTASSSASVGHAATATAKTLSSGADAMFANSDNPTRNRNASHARHFVYVSPQTESGGFKHRRMLSSHLDQSAIRRVHMSVGDDLCACRLAVVGIGRCFLHVLHAERLTKPAAVSVLPAFLG